MDRVDELLKQLRKLKAERERRPKDPYFARPRENQNREFEHWDLIDDRDRGPRRTRL